MAEKKKTVLLINPNKMMPPVAPLGLEYIGSFLAQNQVEVDLLDLTWEANAQKAINSRLGTKRYDLVGVSIRNIDDSSFATRDFVLKPAAEIIKYAKKLAGVPVVLGGCGFSIMPETVLEYCGADFGIAGEGEAALLELLNALCAQREFGSINGLLFKKNSKICKNIPLPGKSRSHIKLFRGLIDNLKYFAEGGQAGIETKAGCNRSCIYCADPLAKGNSIRARDIGQVIDEISFLTEQGIFCFHLCDSEFNIDPCQATELCLELIKSKINKKIKWYTYACPRPFSSNLAKLMKEAGCVGINFGADSADKKILDNLGRDFIPEDIASCTQACREQGIACMVDLLLGGPGETTDTLARTIQFARSLPVDAVGVNAGIRIYPGTVISQIAKREGFAAQNPNLWGKIEQNEKMLEPVFYLSAKLGTGIDEKINGLIGKDNRFMFMSRSKKSYNYNHNMALSRAISKGKRGAYWHILSGS